MPAVWRGSSPWGWSRTGRGSGIRRPGAVCQQGTGLGVAERQARMFPVRNGISRGFHGRTNVANRSKLSSSFCEATVTLIPNPGEDITEKESYRPISLRNQDIKIRSKILANCIQQHIERIICHDLMEFKPEIQS